MFYTVQMSGDGWKVVRPSGVSMQVKSLSYALFLATGEGNEGNRVMVLDKAGYPLY